MFQHEGASGAKPETNAAMSPRSNSHDFPGVHDVARVERFLDRAHDANRLAMLADQKIHLAISNPVFTGARPLHRERACHHPIVESARFGDLFRPLGIDHEHEMKVPIADMTDQGRRDR